MNKAVLYIATSLDGFIAGKNDDISWLFRYNDVDYQYDEFFSTIGAVIQGRRSYDIEFQHGWDQVHPVPTFVLSHRPPDRKPPRDDVVFLADDLAEVLRKARQCTSKDVWIEGGADVAQQFLRRGLLDEIILSIVPVILGEGIRLFGEMPKPIELSLREVKRFDQGLLQLRYEPER